MRVDAPAACPGLACPRSGYERGCTGAREPILGNSESLAGCSRLNLAHIRHSGLDSGPGLPILGQLRATNSVWGRGCVGEGRLHARVLPVQHQVMRVDARGPIWGNYELSKHTVWYVRNQYTFKTCTTQAGYQGLFGG